MRIAQISTLASPVLPTGGGSVETHVWILSRELQQLGHDVTVFASAGSDVPGELVATLPGPYGAQGSPNDWHVCEWINLCRAIESSHGFDVLHSHAYLWGLLLDGFSHAAILHTLHITPDDEAVRLRELAPNAHVSALSEAQWSGHEELGETPVVHHGVDVQQFPFQPDPGDYLLYLGRFTSGKGPVKAVELAKRANLPLRLAGANNAYFRDVVAPLVDGHDVQYIGHVTGPERARLLGGARALLYPLRYPEPFGLVLAEAMLCGTPVLATNLGAVPELIDIGVTGYYGPESALDDLLRQTLDLNRQRIRAIAEQRFSARRMAERYLTIYERIVAERNGR